MVCEWGMSEKMGMVEYGEHEDYVFLGRDISRARDYSEATAEEIDREVRKLIDDAYQTAKQVLTAHRDKLEAIAKALLEYETLDGSQIKEIIEHGRMLNPPPGTAANRGSKNAAGETAQTGGRRARRDAAVTRRIERRARLTSSCSRARCASVGRETADPRERVRPGRARIGSVLRCAFRRPAARLPPRSRALH